MARQGFSQKQKRLLPIKLSRYDYTDLNKYIFDFRIQQVLIKVIRKYRHRYHLLELLTEVNKRVLDKQHGVGQNRAMTVHVPYLTHTLRAKVHLGMKVQ